MQHGPPDKLLEHTGQSASLHKFYRLIPHLKESNIFMPQNPFKPGNLFRRQPE
jgi:hypothetical protein